ncbi:hypothetical protein SLEP1_g8259 [Rubroshorea leprosula]|uniref:Uncharacterized protein n=1 Tax=Rubroshorea leprosula TaxID=152421 RepID=A0AAV5I104_9ROSI|nr:hypothetical protein SLEP1_g8259 [Rubroshorea leprosula]
MTGFPMLKKIRSSFLPSQIGARVVRSVDGKIEMSTKLHCFCVVIV